MLNINQNFDLKAPVFNFDRDYFNSVDELNAYDTSNVPDHFVTNVAGMLYQFTDGEWLPMIGITKDGANNNSQLYLLSNQLGQWDEPSCYISKDANGLNNFRIGSGYKYSELLSDCALNLVKNSNGNSGDYSSSSIQLNAYDTSAVEEHYSTVNIKLLEQDSNTINISPGDGFCHDVWMAGVRFGALKCSANGMSMYVQDDVVFNIEPTQDGSIISGIKSLTAFANPSATKVWATDGSTVDLPNYTNYFNGTTTADKLKSKVVEVTDDTNSVTVSPTSITATNSNTNGSIKILTNKELTQEEQNDRYSPVDISLTANDGYSARINAHAGFIHENEDRMVVELNGDGFDSKFPHTDDSNFWTHVDYSGLATYFNDENVASIRCDGSENYLILGSDDETNFKISRPIDNSEGATITGVKSLTSFSNPSATKVWATDGSTINMPTKFSDLTNDAIYIKGTKGETDARFKIDYNDGDVLRSQLQYRSRKASTCIPELGFTSYDTSGNYLSQIRIRPEDNRDDGQYLIQVQDSRGNKVNCVSSLYPNGFSHQNFVDNTTVRLNSNELSFGPGANDNNFQAQLKIDKDGITKINGKVTEVFAADGSIVDLTTKANVSDLDAKANKSDVLLKKGDNDGYYIENDGGNPGYHSFSIGGNSANGTNSVAVGYDTKAIGSYSHTEGYYTEARGEASHAEGDSTYANGSRSHSEGQQTRAVGYCSHAEGYQTSADGFATHVQGVYNVNNENAIHSVGIGGSKTRKNAEYIYSKKRVTSYLTEESDPKNGYKYLIGVGGYDGISTDNTTYKSVQEVIADLTARIEQLETKVKALEDANTPA